VYGLNPYTRLIPGKAFGYLKRVRAGPQPPIIGELGLPPAFSGASPGWTPVSRTASGQDSAPVQTLSGLRGPMFLLNSQVPLVTAACGPRVIPQDRRHPFSRSYGANLPSSLAWVSPQTPWASHPGAPVSVLGTVAGDRSPPPFQGPPGSVEGPYGPHSRLQPLLTVTVLRGLHRLAGSRLFSRPRSTYPEALEAGLALPHLPPRHGNINPFPLPRVRVTARVRTG